MSNGKANRGARLAAIELGNLRTEREARLSAFESDSERALRPFIEDTQRKPTPDVMYHYTDYLGLHSILESGLIRFGDVFAMNDPSELYHGMRVSVDVLRQRVKRSDSQVEKAFLGHYQRFTEEGLPEAAHFQVCCFSALGDSLSQWRAYADNGAGYALGFNGQVLQDAYAQLNGKRAENRSVFHLTYDDERLAALQDAIIGAAYGHIRFGENGGGSDFLRDLSVQTSLQALLVSLFFKHEAYADEKEFRFVTVEKAGSLEGMKRRVRPHELVRYTEFDWRALAKNALVEVVVGPAAPSSAELFVRDCAREYHHRAIKVRRSKIPYRIPHK
jgi:hypothetical protein